MSELRAVTLSGYVDLAKSLGLDPFWMLRQAGIPPSLLDVPENRLSAGAVLRLLDRSARGSGRDSFGLLLAEPRSFASLGALSLLLERLGTMRDVVRAMADYRRHINDVLIVDLTEDTDTAVISLDVTPDFAGTQSVDLALGVAFRVLTQASGGKWLPASVHVVHKAPNDLAVWHRFFPVPIQFGSTFNGFAASKASLDLAIPLADAAMAGHAARLLQLVQLPPEAAPLSERTRRIIALLLPSGQAKLETVAARMSLSPRVLQRRLEQEGKTFAVLLNRIRRDLAQSYLAGSAQPVTDLASQLGYASPSAFTRWFAGEFGVSPRDWRVAQKNRTTKPPPMWRV